MLIRRAIKRRSPLLGTPSIPILFPPAGPVLNPQYNVYANTGVGDFINYSTPIATVDALTYSPAALAPGSNWTFAVRAFDTVSTIEENNLDARVNVVLDASGNDITAQPASPTGFTATIANVNGVISAKLTWHQLTPSGGIAPTAFNVFKTLGSSISYISPTVIAYVPGKQAYWTTLSGLTGGSQYTFAVRAVNGTVSELNTNTITVTANATPPNAVQSFAASLT